MTALNQEAFRICLWMWVAFVIVWLIGAARAKPTEWRENLRSRLSYSVLTVVAVLLVFSRIWECPWLEYPLSSRSQLLSIAGVALTGAGLGIAIWARLYIGKNWSGSVTLKVGHQLMRSGPYRLIRHPIYSGLLLAIAGTALANLRVRSVIGVVCLWLSFLIKSRIEERLMQQTFGPEYAAYKQQTGALLPRF